VNVVQVFFVSFFGLNRAGFVLLFVGLISVEDFVESCCFWLLVVLVPVLFYFSLVLMGESTL
jgi:hypothetical protein